MFLTRLGSFSKAVITGDETQVDCRASVWLIEAHARSACRGLAVVEFGSVMSCATVVAADHCASIAPGAWTGKSRKRSADNRRYGVYP